MNKSILFILGFFLSFLLSCGQACVDECDAEWDDCSNTCAAMGVVDFESFLPCSLNCEESYQSCEDDCYLF